MRFQQPVLHNGGIGRAKRPHKNPFNGRHSVWWYCTKVQYFWHQVPIHRSKHCRDDCVKSVV